MNQAASRFAFISSDTADARAALGKLSARYGQTPVEEADIFDLVPNIAKPKALKYALSNSFGFGGVNAALVFGKAPA